MNIIKNFKDMFSSTKATTSPPQARIATATRARRLKPLGLLLLIAALFATALSVPSLHIFAGAQAGVAAPAATAVTANDGKRNADLSGIFSPGKSELVRALLTAPLLPMPQAGPPDPVVSFYASDCTTPKTIFNPGDTVCAKITGINTSIFTTHFDWANADGAIKANSTNITVDGSTRTFALSSSAGVGGWRAILVDQSATTRATGDFTVSDPANLRTDLSVNSRAQDRVTAGNDITQRVVVFNNGPDSAQTVSITEPVPANTTFVAVAQLSGPTFSCANNAGVTTCTIASMPAGSDAVFSTTYTVDTGVPNDTTITSSVTATNSVVERNSDDNSASSETITANSPCVVTCGDNITVPVDTGQSGAVVTYTAPTSTGSCGTSPISCSSPSGSFFKIGTTPVTCVGDTGDACSFTVTVENPGALSITLEGNNPFALECGSVVVVAPDPDNPSSGLGFNDPGATAINGTGDPVPVVATGNVDSKTAGTYTVTYTATEGENSVSTTRTVTVADTTKPAIEVDGANPYQIQTGSCFPFVDPGASATDGCAGPVGVTSSISGPGGRTAVDTNVAGTYTVTYSADDLTHFATATRTVLVGDFPDNELDQPPAAVPPTIRLNPINGNDDHQITIECQGSFTDPGATATACGQPVTVTTSGSVDASSPGVYTITYTATSAGGTAEAVRTITVNDTTPAVITLNGSSPYAVECHSVFTDPGANANDACAGSLPVTASGTVDANTPGTYVITYSAPADPAGNPTESVTRTVVVSDTLAPVITITGDNPATVECHTSYTDAGATANDACDGSVSVTSSGSVDVNTPGTYTINYSATDGTHPGSASRTVNVVDTIKPVITRTGAGSVTVECHTSYTDAGATASDSCDSSVPVTTSGAVDVDTPGTYVVTYNASDDSGNAAVAVTRTVTVVDTTPPTITLNGQTPSLWPANHDYHTFQVTDFVASAGDSCSTSLGVGDIVITKVTSDEVEDGLGDGTTVNDILIAAGCKSVQLRAERNGGSNGRVYTITFSLRDAAGNTTTATAKVVVPHDPNQAPVDSGVLYTVNGCP